MAQQLCDWRMPCLTAQCLECMGEVEEALSVVQPLAERLLPAKAGDRAALSKPLPEAGDAARLADHAMVLLYIKLRFITGHTRAEIAQLCMETRQPFRSGKKDKGVMPEISSWDRLLSVVDAWSKHVELAIRQKMPTHWAYGLFVRQLQRLHGSPSGIPSDPEGTQARNQQILKDAPNKEPSSSSSVFRLLGSHSPWIPIVGDSHCLSLAWTRLMVSKSGGARAGGSLQRQSVVSESPIVVPFVVTGLKAWHMQEGYSFVTSANLDCALKKILEQSRCCARYRTLEHREKVQKKVGRGLMSGFIGEEAVLAVHGSQTGEDQWAPSERQWS